MATTVHNSNTGENIVELQNAGTTKVTVDPNGLFGIGTTTPAVALEIVQSSAAAVILQTIGNPNNDSWLISGGASVFGEFHLAANGATNSSRYLTLAAGKTVINDLSGDLDFIVKGTTSSNLLYVDAGNNRVGVKTSTPGVELDVNGQLMVGNGNGSSTAPPLGFRSQTQTGLYTDSAGNLNIARNGTQEWSVGSNNLLPRAHKTSDLGQSAAALNNVYSKNYPAVADFPWPDFRKSVDGQEITIDDIAELKKIQPLKDTFGDDGLPIWDDSTIPRWMVSKDSNGNELVDPDGKNYVSLNLLIAICVRAIVKLDERLSSVCQSSRGEAKSPA